MNAMHFARPALALLVAALSVAGARADELSLAGALEQAIRNNPSIAADLLAADAARHAARGARALTNPEILVAPSVVGEAGADSALLFSQPLELNGTRRVRGQIAASEAGAAFQTATTTQRDVMLQVKTSYWEVARAQELVRLNEDNLKYLETLRAAAQKQYDVGAVPGSQVIKTEVELARAKQELAQAQLELAQVKAALNTLLSRPSGSEFSATDPLVFTDVRVDREQLIAAAGAQRPEVAAAQFEVAASQGKTRAAKLLRVPDLALQARRATLERVSESGVAIAVNLPILDWGSAKSEKRKAESETQSRQKRLEAVRNQVSLDVAQAISQVETSSQIVREYQGGIIEKSEQLAEMARKGYEKGATSYLEVLEAQRTLRGTRTAYYTALASYAKSVATLEWAAGCTLSPGVSQEVRK